MKVIKSIATVIAPIVLHVFNSSLISSIFPNGLKIAKVRPVPKLNGPPYLGNFCPISDLPALSSSLQKSCCSSLFCLGVIGQLYQCFFFSLFFNFLNTCLSSSCTTNLILLLFVKQLYQCGIVNEM